MQQVRKFLRSDGTWVATREDKDVEPCRLKSKSHLHFSVVQDAGIEEASFGMILRKA